MPILDELQKADLNTYPVLIAQEQGVWGREIAFGFPLLRYMYSKGKFGINS